MLAFLLAAAAVAAVGAAFDVRTGHIPNRLTLGALAAAPVLHLGHAWWTHGAAAGATRLGASLLGALACGLVPYLAFRRGVMGGGDVKLFAAIGALCLPFDGLDAQVHAFAAAALIAPARLAYEGKLLATLKGAALVMWRAVRPRSAPAIEPTPPELATWFRLGPSIFAGVALVAVARMGVLR